MRQVKSFIRFVDNLSDLTGKIVAMLIVAMMFVLAYEVFMRYVLNSPTIWANECAGFLFGAHLILGGAYCLRWQKHVNIDILYDRIPLRARAILDLFTWVSFYIFCGVLLWESGKAGWISVGRMEVSHTPWGVPVWPLKLTIPLAAGLILLQGLTKTTDDLYIAITGRELISKAERLREGEGEYAAES